MDGRIKIIQGDITTQRVDVIVNAANQSLLGGGGVDGAIHRAAGPELLEACRRLNGCATGGAKITAGYRLPAKYVVHAVGPVWQGGGAYEAQLLAACYRKSMQLAIDHGAKSIAFPAISTGAYGYPVEEATTVALREVSQFLLNAPEITAVHMVCFDGRTFATYRAIAERVLG